MPPPASQLERAIALPAAIMLGLGSILGTGVFVSVLIGAQTTGPSVVIAIAIAGLVAACNALSSAQLAANHPTSGGTYEYGYTYLTPTLGFSAGWLFLCAKSASAATAALGFATYTLALTGHTAPSSVTALALLGVLALGVVVLSGVRRSSTLNSLIVSITLLALLLFVAAGLPTLLGRGLTPPGPFFDPDRPALGLLEATALMFVAYTGYGRIATVGEEVCDPQRTIPRAIVATLLVSMGIYIAVGIVSVAAMGSELRIGTSATPPAPLSSIAECFGFGGLPPLVSIGAITAMLGVLLNLILGLSRTALAMGRRGDLPAPLARLNAKGTTPTLSVLFVLLIILGLTAMGSIRTAWSFSAFTVLIYYAITNLASIRLTREQRLYPAFVSWAGLGGCLGLAFFVEPRVWMIGLGVLGAGQIWRLIWRWVARRGERGERPPESRGTPHR